MTPDATPPEDALQALPPAVEFTAPPQRPRRRSGRAVLFAGVAGACVLGAGLGLWARPGMSERRLALLPPTPPAPTAAAPHGLQVIVDGHSPPVGPPMQVLPVSAATASVPSASPMPLPVFSPPPHQAMPAPAPEPAFSRPAIQTASAEAAPHASFSPKLASLITAAMAAPHMLLAKLETPPKAEPAQLAQADAPSKAERQAQARDQARARARAEAQAREDARVQARNEARADADRAAAKAAAHRLALAQAAEAQAAQKAARDEAAAERLAQAKTVRQHAADLKLAQAKAQARAAHAKAVEIQLAKAEAALAAKAAAAGHAAKLAQAHAHAQAQAQAQALAQAQAKSEKAEAVRLAKAEAKGRAEARPDARAEALAEAREEARKQIRLASLVRTIKRALPHEARPQPAPVQTARLDRKHAKAAARREAVIERASAHRAARAAPPPSHARAAPVAPLVAPSGLMKVSTRCAQRDPGEALVCADPNLGAADRQLARAYQGARAAGVPDAQLQRQQQRWLAARTAAAREAPWAVHDVYMARIAELNGLAKDAHGDGY